MCSFRRASNFSYIRYLKKIFYKSKAKLLYNSNTLCYNITKM
nr:MAG TPA: hypothetical protein [Caudoviricetes sp.]